MWLQLFVNWKIHFFNDYDNSWKHLRCLYTHACRQDHANVYIRTYVSLMWACLHPISRADYIAACKSHIEAFKLLMRKAMKHYFSRRYLFQVAFIVSLFAGKGTTSPLKDCLVTNVFSTGSYNVDLSSLEGYVDVHVQEHLQPSTCTYSSYIRMTSLP